MVSDKEKGSNEKKKKDNLSPKITQPNATTAT
jgi:hypothetical protein